MSVVKTSLVDTIIETIKQRIRLGLYAPGQRLIAAEIETLVGTSRGPVREALKRLAAEGIIDLTHQKGARVRTLSRAEIVDAFGVREALEGYAAGLAAREEADARLRELLRKLESRTTVKSLADHADFRAYNDEFHALVLRMAGNAELGGMIQRVGVRVSLPQFSGYFGRDRALAARAEHREIARAILSNDVERAESSMRSHIRVTRDFLLESAARGLS